MYRWWILGGLVVATWLFGPWVPVLALASLGHPRVREVVRPDRPWRGLGILVALGLIATAVAVVVPDGWLPLPPGAGTLMAPKYVGRAALDHPITGLSVPQHPGLAKDGSRWAGPAGDRPQVKSAWYGLEECAHLARSTSGSLVGLCEQRSGSVLRSIDPDTLRPTDSLELPAPGDSGCDSSSFLDAHDRAVVATTDRRILTIGTSKGLRVEEGIELGKVVPAGDCLAALMPTWDHSGRVWFVTQEGRVGIASGAKPKILELGAQVVRSLAVDQHAAYVVTVDALYRLSADDQGRPTIDWVKPYDHATTPTPLPNNLMAVTDNTQPRMHVVFLRRSTGEEVCEVPVFEDGKSATENSPVAVGPAGVVVENNAGYSGPQSTLLGMSTPGGLARVDLVDGRCKVAWTADVDAPSSVAKVSLRSGLVYAVTKRSSLAGVSAWYLSAIDAATGRVTFGVRIGLGLLAGTHDSAVTLTPDGSAYAATLGGLVRVKDR